MFCRSIAMAIFCLTLVCANSFSQAKSALSVGDDAPDFKLANWLNLHDDDSPSLSNLKGKVVMVEFWGTW